MQKKNPIYRLGEATWILGTLGLAALAVMYVGLPAADYVDVLLFGPKPRDPSGFFLLLAWIAIIPNIVAAPFFFVYWLSNKVFGGDKEDEGSE